MELGVWKIELGQKREKHKSIDKFLVDAIAKPQSAMRPSLYRPGVVLFDLESCFSQNKGLRDKIGLDLNFPKINRDRRPDHAPLAV
jgi:hypothetical protein